MSRNRIRTIAEAQGLDAAKLSRKSDVSYGTIWRLWTQPETDVRKSILDKIAQALGVPTSALLDNGEK